MKQITLKFVFATIILCGSISTNAQKIITFEAHDTRTSAHKSTHKKDWSGSNSVTVGFASFLNGYIPFYYERKVTSLLAVQIGFGVTMRSYLNDLGSMVFSEGEHSETFGYGFDVTDNYEIYQYRKTMPGLYASIAPKIYVQNDGMDGIYLAPIVELKQYRFNAQLADVTQDPHDQRFNDDKLVPRTSDKMKEYMNCTDFTMNVGGHYQFGNHVAFGWSVGVGVRNLSSERLDVGKVEDAAGNTTYANSVHSFTSTRPMATFNFTIGPWF